MVSLVQVSTALPCIWSAIRFSRIFLILCVVVVVGSVSAATSRVTVSVLKVVVHMLQLIGKPLHSTCDINPHKKKSATHLNVIVLLFELIDLLSGLLFLLWQVSAEHSSVEECRREQQEPIDLDKCLEVFTSEEELTQDESWYCSRCKKHQLASKKLQIWRLPPVLVR